jgi:riboflavin synthase
MQRKYQTINNKIKKLTTKTQSNQKSKTFYKCTENLIVTFTEAEVKLLGKALKYNLHYKHRHWILTLATEADTTICKMHAKNHIFMRQIVVNNIQKLINEQEIQKESRQTHKLKLELHEQHTINSIKKINKNQLIVTKAGKGNTLVILHKDNYNNKIKEFITNNNYIKLPYDIRNKQQNNIRHNINCNNIINKVTYGNIVI